jgi:methylated-DNA-[protein]-cysteine S-methyltransferase
MTEAHCIGIATSWGKVEVVANDAWTPLRIMLPGHMAPARIPRCAVTDAAGDGALLCHWIESYLAGEQPRLPCLEKRAVWLGAAGVAGFRLLASHALCAVPYGCHVTYRQLAVLAGSPGAARAAGIACSRNPFPLLIPCHRVVPAAGGPGRYSGGGGVETKVRLWQLEAQATG